MIATAPSGPSTGTTSGATAVSMVRSSSRYPGLSTASRQYASGPYSTATAPRAASSRGSATVKRGSSGSTRTTSSPSFHCRPTTHQPSAGAVSTAVPLTVNVGCSAQCGTRRASSHRPTGAPETHNSDGAIPRVISGHLQPDFFASHVRGVPAGHVLVQHGTGITAEQDVVLQ